jgi:hypothetical protein
MSLPFSPPSRAKKLTSYFRIYRNPRSATWRAEFSVPDGDLNAPTAHAYVGTLTRHTGNDGLSIYEGPIAALDSAVLRRDTQLAARETGPVRPVLLRLIELPRGNTRKRE